MRVLGAAALAAALLVAACVMYDGPPPTPRSPLPGTAAPVPTASFVTPAPTIPMPSGATVTLDASLIGILPSSVGGVPVTQEPESFTEAIKDPSFVASIDRALFVIAVSGNDLASGVVAHVRPGVYSDKMYSDWRASYDEGACAQSNGVVAHAEQTLAGRTTYVTTCGGGLRVYHTYLRGTGVIVSVFSLGSKGFGAKLMGGIGG